MAENSENGINFSVKQINRSLSKNKGTLRGLHLQKEPMGEGKIVTCLSGAIFDVAVDVREGSKTFGQWVSVELNENNMHMLYVPHGFAHGFVTLTDDVEMHYIMEEEYSAEHATGFMWNDPVFAIDWPIVPAVISEKDKQWKLIG